MYSFLVLRGDKKEQEGEAPIQHSPRLMERKERLNLRKGGQTLYSGLLLEGSWKGISNMNEGTLLSKAESFPFET